MTRIFLDFEFTGLHQETTPISLGITSDCDKTFYAEFSDYDRSQVDQWIEENVIKKLRFSPPPEGQQEYFRMSRVLAKPGENSLYDGYNVELRGDKTSIKEQLEAWLKQFDRVEVWGDCLAYDWMLFCQIFGHAFNIPKNVYYIPFDLCTLLKSRGIDPDINREDFARGGEYWYTEDQIQKHNALWDAKVIKACVDRIEKPLHQQQAIGAAPEEAIIFSGPAGQLLDSQNKLNAAQAEINQLKQKHAERVSDDQKYLVEPLCSAETQVDELRAELAKKDSLIETILKQFYPLKDHLKRLIFALEMFKGTGIANGWFDGYSKRNFNAIEIAICESEVILKFLRLNGAEAAYQSAGEVNGMNLPEASDGKQKTSKTPRTDAQLKLEAFFDGAGIVETVLVEFAQRLETELTEAQIDAKILGKKLKTEREHSDKQGKLIQQMRTALENTAERIKSLDNYWFLLDELREIEAALAAAKERK